MPPSIDVRVLAMAGVLGGALGCGAGAGAGGDADAAGGDAATCAPTVVPATPPPLDLLLLVDQSGSMADPVAGGTKWQALTAAISDFVQAPPRAGLRVGLTYFAVAGPGGDSCVAADYAAADVELGPAEQVAGAIAASLGLHGPSTGAPTAPALAGALAHARAWATSHAEAVAAVALVTDGAPTDCDTSPTNLAAIAAAARAGTPPVSSAAIGLGPGLGFLDAVAAAGGGASIQIALTGAVSGAVRGALDAVAARAVACQYAVPAAAELAQLNLIITAASGAPRTVPGVAGADACATEDGWYVDDAAAPIRIALCPATCAAVDAAPAPQVELALGCATVSR